MVDHDFGTDLPCSDACQLPRHCECDNESVAYMLLLPDLQ